MYLNRKVLDPQLVNLLVSEAYKSDMPKTIKLDKLYFDYTEEEKKRTNSIISSCLLYSMYEETAIVFNDKDDRYLLVSSGDYDSLDDSVFCEEEISLAEIFVLLINDAVRIKDSAYFDLYNALFAYDDPDYSGLLFDDLSEFFVDYSLYKISKDSELYDADPYRLYSYYLIHSLDGCKKEINDDTKELLEEIILMRDNIPYVCICDAIKSQRWEHMFLESYRIIEHVFPMLYVKKLHEIGIDDNPMTIAKLLETGIGWRPIEDQSLSVIFEETESIYEIKQLLDGLSVLKESPEENNYKWYYQGLRNPIVHFRAIHKRIQINNEQWNNIIQLNFRLINYLYDKYKNYSTIDF